MGGYLLLGAWVCESGVFGEALNKYFGPEVSAAPAAKAFRYGAEAFAALALSLLAGVSLAEHLVPVPLARLATPPRESGSRSPALSRTTQ